jgi:hypothetical protein
VLDILELSDSKLRVRLDESVTYEDGGTVFTQTGEVYSTFERE